MYHSDLNFSVKTKHVVIVDEADHLILRDPEAFMKVTKSAPTICFSATSADTEYESTDKKVIQDLGFNFYTYWPSRLPMMTPPGVDKVLQPKSADELVQFIRGKAGDCPVLIYCSSALRDDIKRSVTSSVEVTVETDAA